MKKNGKDALFARLGSMGGKALVKKRGKKYFKELSVKGIAALRAKYK